MKDVVRKIISMSLGQIFKSKKYRNVQASQTHAEKFGHTLVNIVEDNLYEGILEQYIGKPIIIELSIPNAGGDSWEARGILLDYSEQFITIINKEHECEELYIIDKAEDKETEDYNLEIINNKIKVTNKSESLLVIKNCKSKVIKTESILLKGSYLQIPIEKDMKLLIRKLKTVDAIIPRDLGKIRHASV